jgi:hypothetical protein
LADFRGIPHDQILSVWPGVVHWIEAACDTNGKYHQNDILTALLNRDMQLWTYGTDAVCVTEIIQYPRKKYARILIGTGRGRANWQHCRETIETWAKAQGCHGIESLARNGWKRIFKDYSQTHLLLEKIL